MGQYSVDKLGNKYDLDISRSVWGTRVPPVKWFVDRSSKVGVPLSRDCSWLASWSEICPPMLFSMELFFHKQGIILSHKANDFWRFETYFAFWMSGNSPLNFKQNLYVPIKAGLYGSKAYNQISTLAHHSSHPWNVVCHLCLVLHNICFSSWPVGGSFPNYMLNKDKFAPGQNFEASGATSTAENTKGKNRTLRVLIW